MRPSAKTVKPFTALRKVFLSELVDFDLLAAAGDASKLVSQFMTILAAISFAITAPLVLINGLPQESLWGMEHFLIATTMAFVGIFAIVSWESIFPARKDLLILSHLPLRLRTVAGAKLSALASAFALGIAALNVFTGVGWAQMFEPAGGGLPGLVRCLCAYWITMFAAGLFVFLCILFLHGVSSLLLPRSIFLKLSGGLQTVGFLLILADYVLEPSLESIAALTAPGNQHLLHMLPSYWFLGMFQEINGSMQPAFASLAQFAWKGIAVAVSGAFFAVLMAYWRTIPRILEMPEIQPGAPRWSFLPWSGLSTPLNSAISAFSLQTLLRSRQHRTMLGFVWGAGLIFLIFGRNLAGANKSTEMTVSFLSASLLTMVISVLGTRFIMEIPVQPKANWIFQTTQIHAPTAYLAATKRALMTIAILPTWLMVALFCLRMHDKWDCILHLAALGLIGKILADVAGVNLNKLPFACAWLPGKANFLVFFFGTVLVGIPLASHLARLEMRLLQTTLTRVLFLLVLAVASIVSAAIAKSFDSSHKVLAFEEEDASILVGLNLQ